MALIQRHKNNFAIQDSDIPIDGVEYYEEEELDELFRNEVVTDREGNELGPKYGVRDDDGNVVSYRPPGVIGAREGYARKYGSQAVADEVRGR